MMENIVRRLYICRVLGYLNLLGTNSQVNVLWISLPGSPLHPFHRHPRCSCKRVRLLLNDSRPNGGLKPPRGDGGFATSINKISSEPSF
jgi:hypothetical protein